MSGPHPPAKSYAEEAEIARKAERVRTGTLAEELADQVNWKNGKTKRGDYEGHPDYLVRAFGAVIRRVDELQQQLDEIEARLGPFKAGDRHG